MLLEMHYRPILSMQVGEILACSGADAVLVKLS